MPLRKVEVENEGKENESITIVELPDPLIVLTYSISSSVTSIASAALLFSNLLLLFAQ